MGFTIKKKNLGLFGQILIETRKSQKKNNVIKPLLYVTGSLGITRGRPRGGTCGVCAASILEPLPQML